MFLFFLFRKNCWENHFGREMYKLYMFDFIASICITLLFDLPTKFLKETCPSCWLVRLSGKQRFLIPFNVLDLVYNQTVLWVGVFYCPLLPFLGLVKLVLAFYFKKFKVLRCCVPEERMFRASSSAVLFHFMLLLGLFMAVATLGLDLHIPKPSSCGPSEGSTRVLNVTGICVASLPGPAQFTLRYVASEAFVMPLIMAEILILSVLVILGRANRGNIEGLKKLLVMCSADKPFLVERCTLLLEDHAAAKERDSLNRSVGPPDPSTDLPTDPTAP
ncbi:hypothetical protein CRUP_003002 [Coryphaenoides rupestris]|nr:hypothetical protein CRUP_003002 [Coryphaenoides rupestris]